MRQAVSTFFVENSVAQEILDTSDDGYCFFDKKWQYLYINGPAEKLSGKTKKELLGKILWDIFPILKKTSTYTKYKRVLKTGKKISFEQFSPLANKWLLIHVYPYSFGVGVCLIDITKRKKIEEELLLKEERFRTLIEKSTDAIELIDVHGKILYTSESIRQVLGYTPSETKTHTPEKYIHPEDLPMFLNKFSDLIKSPGKQVTTEYRVLHKDGSWAWLETTAVNHLKTPHINALVGNFKNITERKQTEAALRQSEEMFHTLADNIPNLVWMAHADGTIFWYNSRWYEFTGKTPRQMRSGWKIVHDPKTLHLVMKRWKNFIKDGKPFEMVFPMRGANGEFRYFLTQVVPVKNAQGTIMKWFGTNTDITRQKEIEQRKDDFISMASHELKTPLTSASVFNQLLLKQVTDNPKATMLIKKMNHQIDILVALISEMLDVTQIQKGKLSFKKEIFLLKELAMETIVTLQQITNHTIIVDWTSKEYIYADKERIRQVITNLLTNAIKYSPGRKEIIIRSRKRDNTVEVSVQDFGIGIPEEEQEYVFDRFYQGQRNHEDTYPGLGLGLYISKEIITRLGGAIWLESQQGKGSTFHFRLPVSQK